MVGRRTTSVPTSKGHRAHLEGAPAFEAREHLLRLVLEATGDGMWDWDIPTGRVWLSPRWLETWGYAPGEIEPTLGAWRELVHPDDRQRVSESADAHIAGRTQVFEEEYRLRTKSGTYCWNRSRGAVASRDGPGRPERMVGIDAVLPSLGKGEEVPARNAQMYQQLFDHMNEGFALHEVICDEKGRPCDYRFLDANSKFEELTGLKARDVLGKRVREVLPNIDSHWIDALGQVALTGRPANLEQYSTPLRRYYRVSAYCPRKGRFACVFSDVTDERSLIESLRESQARFRATFDWASSGIALVELDGGYRECNPAFERIVGYDIDELRKMSFREIAHPDDTEDWAMFQDLTSGRLDHYDLEKQYLRKDGSEFWGKVVVSLVRAQDGKPGYAIRIVHDISEQKRAEEDLLALNAELEQRVMQRTDALHSVNRELEAFSYSVSHDLRAPLRHMTGFVGLLERHAGATLDDKGRRYVRIIAESAQRMGQLIDELLEFSRTGRVELDTTMVDLSSLVEEVRREFADRLEARRVVWKISALPQVCGDRSLFRLALVNLVSNALKFSRTRDETVIEIGEAPSDHGSCTILVKDNGVGFDARYSEKLFGVFQRLHPSEEYEGTGIGLANVKRIIERHGGRISGEGAVDCGATFYITLPKRENDEGARSDLVCRRRRERHRAHDGSARRA